MEIAAATTDAPKQSPAPAVSDGRLVARIKEGDQWAASELVGRYQNRAFATAYHLLDGDSTAAEDMTQEAFIKAFRNLDRFREEASFYTWFHRILVNACLDAKRKKGRWGKMFSFWRTGNQGDGPSLEEAAQSADPSPEADPLARVADKELAGRIDRAMGRLPDKQRLVFQMKAVQGLTIKEIGRLLDSAEGTVKSHLFRATKALRRDLEEWTDG